MRFGNAELHNVVELVEDTEQGGYRLCRIPLAVREYLNPNAQTNAFNTACSEIRFNLVGESATVVLSAPDRPGTVEVHWGPFFEATYPVEARPTAISLSMPDRHEYRQKIVAEMDTPWDPALARLVLPWNPRVNLHAIEGDTEPPKPDQTPPTTMLIYGSSITQGANGVRPTGMYPMRAAQRLGVDLLNLGFSGGALCERAMAKHIAARTDWDFAVLELGRNAYFRMDADEFRARANTFIGTIATAHPNKWIFCIDIFTGVEDYGNQNQAAMNEARDTVREACDRLGLPRLVHIDGRDILPDATGLTTDLVHPSPIGMEEMALNLVNVICRTLEAREDKTCSSSMAIIRWPIARWTSTVT